MTRNAEYLAQDRLNPNAYTHDEHIYRRAQAGALSGRTIDRIIRHAEPRFIGLNSNGNPAQAIVGLKGVMVNTAFLSLNALRFSEGIVLTDIQATAIEAKFAEAVTLIVDELKGMLVHNEGETEKDIEEKFAHTTEELLSAVKNARPEPHQGLDDEVERGSERLGNTHPSAIHISVPGSPPTRISGRERILRPPLDGAPNMSN